MKMNLPAKKQFKSLLANILFYSCVYIHSGFSTIQTELTTTAFKLSSTWEAAKNNPRSNAISNSDVTFKHCV